MSPEFGRDIVWASRSGCLHPTDCPFDLGMCESIDRTSDWCPLRYRRVRELFIRDVVKVLKPSAEGVFFVIQSTSILIVDKRGVFDIFRCQRSGFRYSIDIV